MTKQKVGRCGESDDLSIISMPSPHGNGKYNTDLFQPLNGALCSMNSFGNYNLKMTFLICEGMNFIIKLYQN